MKAPPHQNGYTLKELVIVVAIVALLAGIAVRSYRKYQLKTNRENGIACLVEVQKRLEDYYSRYSAYPTFDNTGLSAVGYVAATGSSSAACPASEDKSTLYTVTLNSNTSVCSAQCYVLTASGVGPQAKDGTLVLSIDPRSTASPTEAYHKQHITPGGSTLDGWLFQPGQ